MIPSADISIRAAPATTPWFPRLHQQRIRSDHAREVIFIPRSDRQTLNSLSRAHSAGFAVNSLSRLQAAPVARYHGSPADNRLLPSVVPVLRLNASKRANHLSTPFIDELADADVARRRKRGTARANCNSIRW